MGTSAWVTLQRHELHSLHWVMLQWKYPWNAAVTAVPFGALCDLLMGCRCATDTCARVGVGCLVATAPGTDTQVACAQLPQLPLTTLYRSVYLKDTLQSAYTAKADTIVWSTSSAALLAFLYTVSPYLTTYVRRVRHKLYYTDLLPGKSLTTYCV